MIRRLRHGEEIIWTSCGPSAIRRTTDNRYVVLRGRRILRVEDTMDQAIRYHILISRGQVHRAET